jgi:hypothetical protein
MQAAKDFYRFLKSKIRIVKYPYWWVIDVLYKLNVKSLHQIPVVINNFNRLTFPVHLISFLEKCGFTNIVILDNDSTYPPLLKYYSETKYQVVKAGGNFGHLSLWKSGLYNKYKWDYFIYSDPDVLPIEECPKDFIKLFISALNRDLSIDKIGFAIKIDDLPDSFLLKKNVIEYEKQYWTNEIKPNFYKANIDTTFALYRPFSNLKFNEIYTLSAIRIGFPYLIRHMPWYMDSKNLSEEESYYIETSNSSSTISKHQNGEGNVY